MWVVWRGRRAGCKGVGGWGRWAVAVFGLGFGLGWAGVEMVVVGLGLGCSDADFSDSGELADGAVELAGEAGAVAAIGVEGAVLMGHGVAEDLGFTEGFAGFGAVGVRGAVDGWLVGAIVNFRPEATTDGNGANGDGGFDAGEAAESPFGVDHLAEESELEKVGGLEFLLQGG